MRSVIVLSVLSVLFARSAANVLGQLPQGPILKTEYGELQIFPYDNPWNTRVDQLKLHPLSKQYVQSVGLDEGLHPDFGTVWNGAPNGIPFVVVGEDQRKVPLTFKWSDESDAGPYPIPPDAPIEGGPGSKGDRHVIVLDVHSKRLYEVFSAYKTADGWHGGSGAIFDLTSNRLRPAGWTSADAAGLPVFAGLARYEEVAEGEIRHALRFTVKRTQRAYIKPATHFASSSTDPRLPPMGLRMRLRRDYDTSGFPRQAKIVAEALKKYGMFLADNGGDWFISGAPNPKWNDEELRWLKRIKGRDLEALDTGALITR